MGGKVGTQTYSLAARNFLARKDASACTQDVVDMSHIQSWRTIHVRDTHIESYTCAKVGAQYTCGIRI